MTPDSIRVEIAMAQSEMRRAIGKRARGKQKDKADELESFGIGNPRFDDASDSASAGASSPRWTIVVRSSQVGSRMSDLYLSKNRNRFTASLHDEGCVD